MSILCTVRFCAVRFLPPMRPAIFLPLKTRPGFWQPPMEPCARCVFDTPCVARCPPKFQRFMAPWKPLPRVAPRTSTSWPGAKCAAGTRVPGGSTASALTRNSASVRASS